MDHEKIEMRQQLDALSTHVQGLKKRVKALEPEPKPEKADDKGKGR